MSVTLFLTPSAITRITINETDIKFLVQRLARTSQKHLKEVLSPVLEVRIYKPGKCNGEVLK
jgi:hypothetical protein